MSDNGVPTDLKVVLSNDEIVRGLKHYRRIAKQDLVRADLAEHPDAFRQHAEARREVYAHLAGVAEGGTPEEVTRSALELYKGLPFVTGTAPETHADVKGRENALENFFLMIGLEPKIRRTVRSLRAPLRSA
ncbi:MAG: hypothetical protein WD336_05525 [Trueperaceae bacterium]